MLEVADTLKIRPVGWQGVAQASSGMDWMLKKGKNMFEVLIREAATRFGLGEKSPALLKMLLAAMTSQKTGGLAGFLDHFKTPELGPIVQSWLGGGPAAQPISNSQLESVLGQPDGLIPLFARKLELDRDNVTSALGYFLPAVVGKMTLGGSIPSKLPAEITSLADSGQKLLDEAQTDAKSSTGKKAGLGKWLPWIIVVLVIIFGLSYCSKNKKVDAPAPVTPATSSAEDDKLSSAADAVADTTESTADKLKEATDDVAEDGRDVAADASKAASSATDAVKSAADSTAETAKDVADSIKDAAREVSESASDAGSKTMDYLKSLVHEPAGSDVVALHRDGRPAMNVYFDSGKSDVESSFADKSDDLVTYLKNRPWVKAVVSGFNDSTGDADANEALAKKRAENVGEALTAAGVDERQIKLEKPVDTHEDNATDAATRRVEVILKNEEPKGSAVLMWLRGELPALNVYFDTGVSDVHKDFEEKSKHLVDYLKSHDDVAAVVSGYHDPTGNAAANEELAKKRAVAVQQALIKQGVAEKQVVLEKPDNASDTRSDNATARRVEVQLRKKS